MTIRGLATPVLLIIFDRPESTQRVFERIRAVKPPKLYVWADGPRSRDASEEELCSEVRAVKDRVDWPCEVKTWYRDDHLGSDKGVAAAIDWFFQNEPEGIILEDDCVPEEPFFRFCEQLLERYRDDNRIMHICGINPLQKWEGEPYSYYYSRHASTGGWASWRRAWRLNDFSPARYEKIRRHGYFEEYFPTKAERTKWFRTFDLLSKTSDPQARWMDRWAFSRFIQSGLSIVPRETLVAHLPDGRANGAWITDEGLQHPPFVMRSMEADTVYSNSIARQVNAIRN